MVNLLTAAEYKDNSIIKSSKNKTLFQKVNLNRRVGEFPGSKEFICGVDTMHIKTYILHY